MKYSIILFLVTMIDANNPEQKIQKSPERVKCVESIESASRNFMSHHEYAHENLISSSYCLQSSSSSYMESDNTAADWLCNNDMITLELYIFAVLRKSPLRFIDRRHNILIMLSIKSVYGHILALMRRKRILQILENHALDSELPVLENTDQIFLSPEWNALDAKYNLEDEYYFSLLEPLSDSCWEYSAAECS